ncbi:hypothetical protein DL93DRAFT_600490 [Clavulina sp. PMI_390]|nr:hypothetical protein DL93DRAFT_600490 [Clavulina sp. PMI_390]
MTKQEWLEASQTMKLSGPPSWANHLRTLHFIKCNFLVVDVPELWQALQLLERLEFTECTGVHMVLDDMVRVLQNQTPENKVVFPNLSSLVMKISLEGKEWVRDIIEDYVDRLRGCRSGLDIQTNFDP